MSNSGFNEPSLVELARRRKSRSGIWLFEGLLRGAGHARFCVAAPAKRKQIVVARVNIVKCPMHRHDQLKVWTSLLMHLFFNQTFYN